MPKNCDACQAANAFVYCRADAAYLCTECDSNVHGANKLAFRHERVWLCQVCEQAPAAVTCKADSAALCVACDVDIHMANPLASRHERTVINPFYICPDMVKGACISAVVPSSLVNGSIEDQECSLLLKDDGDESSAAEAASWLLTNPNTVLNASSKDAISSKCRADVNGYPSLDRDACTKSRKERLAKNCHLQSSDMSLDVEPYIDLEYVSGTSAPKRYVADSLVPVHAPEGFGQISPSISDGPGSNDANEIPKSGKKIRCTPISTYSMYSSPNDTGVVPDASTTDLPVNSTKSLEFQDPTFPLVPQANALEPVDREARVLRYKEKRKNRKFEKTIRYASRKAYAETRPRIKGRFAKRGNGGSEEMHQGVHETGFGIVPSL
ncbi:hypothetical protein O6H91_13G097200 [Diphasiastrum complanatum]|nr:hypothetical protein O6H91_13G095700 [Diphasiastrum complanatum]KAJ7534504.1 hypothetical protein O6H91_13G097200 [Diphasiastrum complanatum]KAJ7534505.1 hypothetical protein O6H91_13G097200 [Diphasiastrum complanatum]KAJ7534506.1 hypothetical protein O6H91_13G097200 [Diphasiastrum complanatum]KAJ7534507.1 hypothetical protein O6H91_13G097200 [Diphasiastrum complanatum]